MKQLNRNNYDFKFTIVFITENLLNTIEIICLHYIEAPFDILRLQRQWNGEMQNTLLWFLNVIDISRTPFVILNCNVKLSVLRGKHKRYHRKVKPDKD